MLKLEIITHLYNMNSLNILKAPHYNSTNIEVIDIIESYELNFHLGNAIKYLLRSTSKYDTPTEDVLKATYYLHRAIDNNILPTKPPKVPISIREVMFGRSLPREIDEAIRYILYGVSQRSTQYRLDLIDSLSKAIIILHDKYKFSNIPS